MRARRFRIWCGRSGLFHRAWGLGLLIALVPMLSSAKDIVAVCAYGAPRCLWNFGGLTLGLITAGIVAHRLVMSQGRTRIAEGLLLTGLAFIFAFPFIALVLTVWAKIEEVVLRDGQFTVANDQLIGYFVNYWWDDFEAFGVRYLVGIALGAATYLWLPRSEDETIPASLHVTISEIAPKNVPRFRDIALALSLLVIGAVVAWFTWAAAVNQEQSFIEAARSWNHPPWFNDAEQIRVELWRHVFFRAFPFLTVGCLLLVPFWRRR